MQVKCTDSQLSHTASTAGSNQMNPFHYLHLQDHGADIRGSQIALYFRYTGKFKATAMVAVNFMDGRWPKTVQEPELRIKGILDNPDHASIATDPFFIHLVYLTSVIRWWTNALKSFHEQLITYESQLQDNEAAQDTASQQNINKALHAMAAHLHRYSSELTSMENTIMAISGHHKWLTQEDDSSTKHSSRKIEDGLNEVASQLKSVQNFESELEKKTQNILALVSQSTPSSSPNTALLTHTKAFQPHPAQ